MITAAELVRLSDISSNLYKQYTKNKSPLYEIFHRIVSTAIHGEDYLEVEKDEVDGATIASLKAFGYTVEDNAYSMRIHWQ